MLIVDVLRINAGDNPEVLRSLRIFGDDAWLIALAIAFAAVKDRCPVWQTLAPKLEALRKREKRA